MIPRLLNLSDLNNYFIFGPRGTGKSTWLRQQFPKAPLLDLLRESHFQEFLRNPSYLQPWIEAQCALLPITDQKRPVMIIDEIQRLPALLNEVHRLIELKKYQFILTGSSARKLRRAGTNLLAGRALVKEMHPLSAEELGSHFSLQKSLSFGQLPEAYFSPTPLEYLKSYIGTYLREEIQIEANVRNLATFSKFLESAAFSQASVLSVASIANDCGVDRKTAASYFQVLEDLLIGIRLPVFNRKAKRRTITHSKFYFFDAGVFQAIRPRGVLDSAEEIQGAAIETLVLQEIRAFISNHQLDLQLSFWRTQDQREVDFILYGAAGFSAIEVKRSSRFRETDLKGLHAFLEEYPKAHGYLLYGGTSHLKFGSIEVIPLEWAFKNWAALLTR